MKASEGVCAELIHGDVHLEVIMQRILQEISLVTDQEKCFCMKKVAGFILPSMSLSRDCLF